MDTIEDEFEGFQPRGYTPQPWEGRCYSKLGLIFATLYLVLFFYYPALIILLILSFLTVILGRVGIKNGDIYFGKISFGVGIILVCLTLIFFIISFFSIKIQI